jgi:glycosyltransferase involved in cell wall biosynthesis
MRVAWFSPLPPERSGVAFYNSDLLAHLDTELTIDKFVATSRNSAVALSASLRSRAPRSNHVFDAHDFIWKHKREPYDLITYQLGNASCHDYIWAYLARYPGLVVLHDPRLHHARARQLLNRERFDDYRQEFWYDHPHATRDFVEYAVEGLGGSIYYFWSMLRVVMRTAKLVAVHNARVAADLRAEYPDVAIESIRMGVGAIRHDPDARRRVRQTLQIPDDAVLFAAFGKVTAEKRIPAILTTLATLRREGTNAWLLLVGDADDSSAISTDGVRSTGYLPDEAVGSYLTAADACLCLRWPTALETSASWLRCLAAARATVLTDLPHLVDIPSSVALRVDLLNEERDLTEVMRRLASDRHLRDALARAGHAYWEANHTLQAMAGDYERLLPAAAARLAPEQTDLPSHFRDDHSTAARDIAARFGVDVDILRR